MYLFEGDVAKPPDDVNINPKLFSSDKIRDVQLIYNNPKENVVLSLLVVQFEHCIATASIKNNIFKIKILH